MKHLLPFIYFSALLAILVSCKSTHPLTSAKPDNRKTAELLKEIDSNKFEPAFLSAKASVKFKKGESSNSFKANIRMKTDSVIWVSISAVGYEAARFMITPDSVFLMNRTDRNYYKGNVDFISQKLDIALSFNMLQNLLLGNPVGLDSLDNIKRSNTKEHFLLSSLNKRKVRQLEEKPEKFDQNEVFYNTWIDPIFFRVAKTSIFDLRTNQSATFDYTDFKPIENNNIAHQLSVFIQAAQTAELNLDFSRINVEESLSFSFRIPSKYEQIKN